MINIFIIFSSFFLFVFFISQNKNLCYLSIVFLIPLLIFQYRSTKSTNFTKLTEIEKIEQLDRMNQYPPSTYRIANLVESRSESVIFFKLETNFINTFDLLLIFSKYINIFFLLLFFIGFFEAIKLDPKKIIFFTLIPIILLTIIGHNNLNGPFCLFPMIYSSIVFGLINIFKKHEKNN
jgi:hypothetical protein